MAISCSKLRYLTDEKGSRQEVILPLEAWRKIMGELEVLREKQEILLGLHQACQQIRRQKTKENLPEKTLEDFLNEL